MLRNVDVPGVLIFRALLLYVRGVKVAPGDLRKFPAR